jgi:3-oxoacyl-[acyl-carrier protein] reductase
MTSLQDRSVLVIGATGGLGAPLSRALAAQGAALTLHGREAERLAALSLSAILVAGDLRDPATAHRAVAAAAEAHGRIDGVVVASGVVAFGPVGEVPDDVLLDLLLVNTLAPIRVLQAALPHLVASGAGDWVTLASVAGVNAFPGEAVYNASKFGQVGFTRALDMELTERGVRATNVCPGGVNTQFAIGTGRTSGDPQLDAMMTPDEVADVVMFVLTRPRRLRIMTTTFRPVSEASFG